MMITCYLKPKTPDLSPAVEMFYRVCNSINTSVCVDERRVIFGNDKVFDEFKQHFPEIVPYLIEANE
jgi:hypothetical protein